MLICWFCTSVLLTTCPSWYATKSFHSSLTCFSMFLYIILPPNFSLHSVSGSLTMLIIIRFHFCSGTFSAYMLKSIKIFFTERTGIIHTRFAVCIYLYSDSQQFHKSFPLCYFLLYYNTHIHIKRGIFEPFFATISSAWLWWFFYFPDTALILFRICRNQKFEKTNRYWHYNFHILW